MKALEDHDAALAERPLREYALGSAGHAEKNLDRGQTQRRSVLTGKRRAMRGKSGEDCKGERDG